MKECIILMLAFFMPAHGVNHKPMPQKFDKAGFYAIMRSGDLDAVNKEMEMLDDAPSKEKAGYEGALLMKKADLAKGAKQKLRFFKAGRIKLETALLTDNDNVEFHFLRLTIQEHAPKIVKYHADIEEDKRIVQKNFKSLSAAVQHAILDYCEISKVLHKEEF